MGQQGVEGEQFRLPPRTVLPALGAPRALTALAWSFAEACVDVHSDDPSSAATPLTSGVEADGTICSSEDLGWFIIEAEAGEIITATLS